MKTENRFLIFDNAESKPIKAFVKKCLNVVKRVRYGLLRIILKPSKRNDSEIKYNVSVLSIFKNEAKYLKEWIEFHKIVGIEHFYLYNNNSSDNYLEVLNPYIKKGIVTLNDWEKNQAQMECYCDGLKRFRSESKWIGVIDIDEFVVPNDKNTIYDILKNFENKPAVIVYWKYFGASGLLDREEKALVTESFVVGWQKYADIGKCFYNTAFDFDGTNKKNLLLHHFMWAGVKSVALPPVNIFGKTCLPNSNPIPLSADAEKFPMQINHYFTKSFSEYAEKKSKGDVYFKNNPHTLDYFFEHDSKCCKVDCNVFKYLVKLKLAMFKGDEE